MNNQEEMDSLMNSSTDIEFQQLEEIINEYVRSCYGWYQENKRFPRHLHHISGTTVVFLGALIPLLSTYEGVYMRLTVGIIGVIVSVSAGLNTFFRWEKTWHTFSIAQFDLEYLIRRWELKMNQARTNTDKEEGLKLAREATETLLENTRAIRNVETEEYFRNLPNLSKLKQ